MQSGIVESGYGSDPVGLVSGFLFEPGQPLREIDSTGAVVAISGDPQVLLSQLIDQFVELSGLIVKKTMESILMSHPDGFAILNAQMSPSSGAAPIQTAPPVQPIRQAQGENVQVPQPQNAPPQTTQEEQEVLAANKDIEDLIKGMPKPIVKISGAKRRAANRKSRTKK